MARGQKTSSDKVAEFRRHYLKTGNARESARRCKLPEQTGIDLASKADADKSFGQARSKYLALGLEKATLACLEALDILTDGLRHGPLSDAMGNPIDRRAELARAVTGIRDSLERTAARAEARADKSAEVAGATSGPVTVHVHLKPPEPGECQTSTSILPVPSPEPGS